MSKIRGIKFLPENAVYDVMPSPVGELTIICSPKGLHAILWETDRRQMGYHQTLEMLKKSKSDPLIKKTKLQLTEYFREGRTDFDLPLVIEGTEFQVKAWRQLLKIPYAKTISYGEQAEKLGRKNLARAVGMANGSNPISIVIPCHRVIGSSGHLTGFGGGLDNKKFLLDLEQWTVILAVIKLEPSYSR